MKYDDLDYHTGGEFPDDVPEEHGWTHIGAFLIWLVLHELHDTSWEPLASVAEQLREREIQPADLIDDCDGKLMSEMLNAEGNAFAAATYDRYVEMFEERVGEHVNARRSLLARLARLAREPRTAYHADPGWETYDVVAPMVDELYREWKAGPTRARAGETPAPAGAWTRNYAAMGDEKLLRCVAELRDRRGDAFDRALEHAADPDVHLAAAEKVAGERGLL